MDIKKFSNLYSFSFVDRFFCKLYISKRKIDYHLKQRKREKMRICIICLILVVIYSQISDKIFKLGKSWIDKKFIGLSIWSEMTFLWLLLTWIYVNFQIYLNHKEGWEGWSTFRLMSIINVWCQINSFSNHCICDIL